MAKYRVEQGKIIRSNPFCPRCGRGVFMADRGEWWSCGKCGDQYRKIRLEENKKGVKVIS
jgi:small subunit ribosomal protein S27Ae